MKRIFADTQYFIALLSPKDQWHRAALQASQNEQGTRLVTTQEVLVELLAFFAERGRDFRKMVGDFVDDIGSDPEIQILEQSVETFRWGFLLYKMRPDKGYSLTDCISMEAMRRLGIIEVLTHDQHFAQEGFRILL